MGQSPMLIALPADPTRCPLSDEASLRAMEVERPEAVKQAPCWCSQLRYEAPLSRLLDGAGSKAALCHACGLAEHC